jgi:hypothetical protein
MRKRWALRTWCGLLALWLAASVAEQSDKQVTAAVMTLSVELLVWGMVELVCEAIRSARGEG